MEEKLEVLEYETGSSIRLRQVDTLDTSRQLLTVSGGGVAAATCRILDVMISDVVLFRKAEATFIISAEQKKCGHEEIKINHS